MRKDNVFGLLDHAKNELASSSLKNIEQQYREALTSKTVPISLQIDVKNFMENLRSALDYIAHDIYEKIIGSIPPEKNVYFPYGQTENNFKSAIGSNLPNLTSLNPDIYNLIESVQPYKNGDDWIFQFCQIVNEKKHNTLTPQKVTETGTTTTASTKNVSMTMPINNPHFKVHQSQNVKITLGGIPVKLSDQGIEPLAPGLQITITKWVSFQFSTTSIEVLPFLKKSLEKIEDLSKHVYAKLT